MLQCVRQGGAGEAPALVLNGHIDVVPAGAGWSMDPFGGVVKDGKIWGRGTVDQKGGMAAMVYAGGIIKELGLNHQFTIYFTGTVMEEDCDGLCWQYILKEGVLKPDVVVLDYSMPEETGIDMLKWMNENENTTPVIMVTAAGSETVAGTSASRPLRTTPYL